MSIRKEMRHAIVALACSGMVLPVSAFARTPAKVAKQTPSRAIVHDIALDSERAFTGRVVDEKGNPIEGATVVLSQQSKAKLRQQTSADGTYQFKSVKPGTYELRIGSELIACRVWSPAAAPPAAKANLTSVAKPVIRGQSEFGTDFFNGGVEGIDLVAATALGAGIAGAITGGIALDRANDARDDAQTAIALASD